VTEIFFVPHVSCFVWQQVMYGFFPHLRAFGSKAKQVGEMMLRMRREMGEEDAVGVAPEMDW
jgi:hypothetical protein